ncbi:MAG: hypothetical protein AB7I30_10230, partial [Isosphaeraceae bacterium]
MERITRLCVDATVLCVLICSLLIVYRVDRGLSNRPVAVGSGPSTPPGATPAAPLKLAVTAGGYDDMAALLNALGEGYRCTVVTESDLLDSGVPVEFDALFLTCAERAKDADATEAKLAKTLRSYVQDGGTLYASDLRFDTLALAFPEVIDRVSVAQGLKQNLQARVVSPELHDLLGEEIPLHFDQEGWRPAAFRGKGVTVDLQGTLRTNAGVEIEAPLLARFSSGKGTVIFTSFHNEKQVSEIETRLLNHLVVSTVTAKVEATVTRSMVTGGFSPQRVNLLSSSGGTTPVSQTYDHQGKGRLIFTLGFEPRGATLRLEVVSPSGETRAVSGDSTVTIDVDDPSEGR